MIECSYFNINDQPKPLRFYESKLSFNVRCNGSNNRSLYSSLLAHTGACRPACLAATQKLVGQPVWFTQV